MTLTWITQRLYMGAPGSLADLLRNAVKKMKICGYAGPLYAICL